MQKKIISQNNYKKSPRPKIAICIPTYNNEETIAETLNSIMAQGDSLKHIDKVYLTDDASSDTTIQAALSSWKMQIPFVVFKNNHNLGERENTNRLIHKISGNVDWLIILHSDDLAKEGWLQNIIYRIKKCGKKTATVCCNRDNLINGNIVAGREDYGKIGPKSYLSDTLIIKGNNKTAKNAFLTGCWWFISGCAIRIALFKEIGEFNPRMPQLGDWEWIIRCLDKGFDAEYVKKRLTIYRAHKGSVSSISVDTYRDIAERIEMINEYSYMLSRSEIKELYAKNASNCCKRIARQLLRFYFKNAIMGTKTFWSILKKFAAAVVLKDNIR